MSESTKCLVNLPITKINTYMCRKFKKGNDISKILECSTFSEVIFIFYGISEISKRSLCHVEY